MWSPDSEINSIGMTIRHSISASSGISTLSSCGNPQTLPELPPGDEHRLQRAALTLQQKLILREWLKENRLQNYYSRLIAIEVASLEDVYWLEDSRASQILGKDLATWNHVRQKLPTSKSQLEILKAELWSTVVKTSNHKDAWTYGGMLVVSVSVAGLVTLAAMTQPSLAPEARHSLLQYVTGKYLLPANCRVEWHFEDPSVVGNTMSFTVRFYQRNGNAYPICDTDQFFVEVAADGAKKVVAISELGSSTDPNNANEAKVKFTVRTAGQYTIAIMIGSIHIAGSPFTKNFIPSTISPTRSRLVRPASIVVCQEGLPNILHIEPRDDFGNICNYETNDDPTKGYLVEIFDLHDQLCEKFNSAITLSYDKVNLRINVIALFPEPISLRVRIMFEGQLIPNAAFDLLVLSSCDTTLVHKNIASRKHNICYDAKLLCTSGQPKSKPRKVLCYIGPKQFTIKEMILKIIPKRVATFRLCPSTKIHFLPQVASPTQTSPSNGAIFVIDDGSQPKIEISSKDRNLIAATFTHFLIKNIGGSETFKDKQDFFYHEVRKFHANCYHEKLSLKVQREKILESSMKATKNFSVSDWCGNFEVVFQGEQGIDWGGLRREWVELICAALFEPKGGLFCTFHDKRQALVHPNPNRPSHLKLKYYEFAGKIVGKCLYESALGSSYRQLVRARFTRSFLAQLIGLRVHYKHFEQDDPDLYLQKIKYILDTDLDRNEIEISFVEEVYDTMGQLVKTIDLIPNGSRIRVRNSNKNQYLDALATHRLSNNVKDEIDSFLKGLNFIIPDNLLSIFDENELELLLCGTGEYSIADFKSNHIVNGGSPEFRRVLDWFWAAVSNFSQTEMARLLQFTTGCSQLPHGGFQELNPKFQITAAPTFANRLPTAHTCFNQLCLPDYESYEQFERALIIAISEGNEGFGMS